MSRQAQDHRRADSNRGDAVAVVGADEQDLALLVEAYAVDLIDDLSLGRNGGANQVARHGWGSS